MQSWEFTKTSLQDPLWLEWDNQGEKGQIYTLGNFFYML